MRAAGELSLAQQAQRIVRSWWLARLALALLPPRRALQVLARLLPAAGYVLPVDKAGQAAAFTRWLRGWDGGRVCEGEEGLERAWRAVCVSHAGLYAQAVWHGRKMEVLEGLVREADAGWEALCAQAGSGKGAVVMTFHHDGHHSLCALIARQGGAAVRALAAPEESSPFYPWLARLLRRWHRAAARHFGGGDYLFVPPAGEGAARALLGPLRRGEVVVSLNDVGAPAEARGLPLRVLGRQVWAYSAALELAARMGKAVFAAALVWCPRLEGYRLVAQRLQGDDAQALLDAYGRWMEAVLVRWPWAWMGWQWHEQWPRVEDVRMVAAQSARGKE